jgi:P4 family phage/plasmid primase-like protien
VSSSDEDPARGVGAHRAGNEESNGTDQLQSTPQHADDKSLRNGAHHTGGQLLPRATKESLDLVMQNVPEELLAERAWVCCDRSPKRSADGSTKSSKAPISPVTGGMAKSNDPETWSLVEDAIQFALDDDRCFGLGINLLGLDYVGLDLDHVIDAETGALLPAAQEFLDGLPQTYTEISPSGTGLRLFFGGRLPTQVRGKMVADAFGEGTALECYDGQGGGRYLTVTGNVFQDRTELVDVTCEELQPLVRLQERARAAKSNRGLRTAERPESPVKALQGAQQPRNASDPESDYDRARWGLLEARMLHPDAGYPVWLRVLAALKAIDPGPRGLQLAINWSRQSRVFDPDEIEGKWPGLDGSSAGCLFGMFDDADPTLRDRYRGSAGLGSKPEVAEGDSSEDDPFLEHAATRKRPKPPQPGERFNRRLVLDPGKTLPTAEAYVSEHHLHEEGRTLQCFAGTLQAWNGSRYVEFERAALRHQLQPWLHSAWIVKVRKGDNVGEWRLEWRPFDSNNGTIKGSVAAIEDYTHIPADLSMPVWLEERPGDPPAKNLLPCKSVLLDLTTRETMPTTPRLFTTNGIEFDPQPNAPDPQCWLEFLDQLFGHDPEAVDLLQEFFGYALTMDTTQQKALLIVGPKRSGKGTIARVLTELVGQGNVCGPTVSNLAGPFGLQPLIGKSLAIISDARFRGEGVTTVVERLLCITGEDRLTIDRKNIGSLTVKLPTRFVFLTNELPRFTDQSAALVGRFLILQLKNSFYGKEDLGLTARLLEEMPGILNWALDGLDRLRRRGRFVVPDSSRQSVDELERLSSPMSAFVTDRCWVGPEQRVDVGKLYEAYGVWCLEEGWSSPPTRQLFGRDLRTAVPGLTRRRGSGERGFYHGIGLR